MGGPARAAPSPPPAATSSTKVSYRPRAASTHPLLPGKAPPGSRSASPAPSGPAPDGTAPGLEAYAGMTVEPHTCPECSCSPAPCTLPEGMHTHAAKCPGDDSVAIPFGPPPGWEGACSTEGALPAAVQCDGVPCAQSLSIPPSPSPPAIPRAAPHSLRPIPRGRRRLASAGPAHPPATTAAPARCARLPPEGFALCLYAEGSAPTCPAACPAPDLLHRREGRAHLRSLPVLTARRRRVRGRPVDPFQLRL